MEEKLEALQTAYSYMENLYSGIVSVIEYLKKEEDREASLLLVKIIDGLNWVIEVIKLTEDIQDECIEIKEITPLLRDIVDGLENNDTILIRDILEYEILDILELWYNKIEKVINQ